MSLCPSISSAQNNFLVLEVKKVVLKSDSMYEKSIRFAMKLSLSVTPRGGLRFTAVLVMCCTVVVHISAMDQTPEAQRRGEDQNSYRVSSDGAETVEKQSLLHRVRRAVKKNATPNLPDIEKRLKAMEERYALCFVVPGVVSH